MRFFDSWFGRKSSRPEPKHGHRFLGLERLEDRTVLDASGALTGTTLTITGGGGGIDQLTLDRNTVTNQLVLTEFGKVVGTFDSAAVTQININATALNNNIQVTPAVLQAATINGGPGNNVLQAGS